MFKADVGCYNMLMDAYGRTRQWLEAENTFASMKRRQCVPTETSFNILMAAYSRGGQLERAEQLFHEMQEHNYFPGKADLLLNCADETGRLCFFHRRMILFLAVNFV
jgi:pentatricopeptide repeat protein